MKSETVYRYRLPSLLTQSPPSQAESSPDTTGDSNPCRRPRGHTGPGPAATTSRVSAGFSPSLQPLSTSVLLGPVFSILLALCPLVLRLYIFSSGLDRSLDYKYYTEQPMQQLPDV